jgi:hypothetical protein
MTDTDTVHFLKKPRQAILSDKSMRENSQNVPESSTFRHMCLRDNLTDRAHCGGLGAAEVNLAQILHCAAEEYLSHIHLYGYGLKYSCFNRNL